MEKEENSSTSKKKKKKKKIKTDENSDAMEYTNFEDEIFHKVGAKYGKAFFMTTVVVVFYDYLNFDVKMDFLVFFSFKVYFHFLKHILLKRKSESYLEHYQGSMFDRVLKAPLEAHFQNLK